MIQTFILDKNSPIEDALKTSFYLSDEAFAKTPEETHDLLHYYREERNFALAEIEKLRKSKMNLKDIFSIFPDLGARTLEPNLWFIVYKYYLPHFSADEAKNLADRYMEAIEKEMER